MNRGDSKSENKEISNDSKNLEFCLNKLTEKNLTRKDFKQVFDLLNKIKFDQINPSEIEKLGYLLLDIPRHYKNQDLEEMDPLFLRMIAKQYSWLYPQIASLYCDIAPYISNQLRVNIFDYLRNILVEPTTDEALHECASIALLEITYYLGNKHKNIIYEFFKARFINNKYDHDAIKHIVANWLSVEERYGFFVMLSSLLEQESHDRGWQKDISMMICNLFNIIPQPERHKIFYGVIISLGLSKNYYSRQALVEILDKIKGFEKQRHQLLLAFRKDSHPGVRRFANQSSFLSALTETSKMHSHDYKKEEKKELKQKSLIAAREATIQEKQKIEAQQFEKQLGVTHVQEKLISGLKSKNAYIVELCFQRLDRIYCTNSSLQQKRKWIHILGEALKVGELSFKMTDLVRYIDKLSVISELRNEIALMILAIVKRHINWPTRDWTNLLHRIVSTGVSRDVFNTILNTFSQLMKSTTVHERVKEHLLGTITALTRSNQSASQVIDFIVCGFNYEYGNDFHAISAEILRWELVGIDGLQNINQEWLVALGKINVNRGDTETIEQIIYFMIYVIAQDGGGILGKCAAMNLYYMLKDTEDFRLIKLVHTALDEYHIATLDILKPLFRLLTDKIATLSHLNLYNLACYDLYNLDYQSALKNALKAIRILKSHQYYTIKLHYIAAESCIALGLYRLADHHVKFILSKGVCKYSPARYLKGLIKEKQGNVGEAIGCYKRAFNANPFYLKPLLQLYDLYYQRKNFHHAELTALKIRKLNPGYYLPYDADGFLNQRLTITGIPPFAREIQELEKNLSVFVATAIKTLAQGDQATEQDKEFVLKEFDQFRQQLIQIFGTKALAKLKLFNNIPWENELFMYPSQIKRFMRDMLIEIIRQEIPPAYHGCYEVFRVRMSNLQNLRQQIEESNIEKYLDAKHTVDIQISNFQVLTIYDFVRKYAFSDMLKNGYALGLSGDISQAYNILSGIFGLIHWIEAYKQVGVEPSGEIKDTHQFIDQLTTKNKPIVMFIPVIYESAKHNITLDEIRYLLTFSQNKNIANRIIFVFDAYNFLPMFLLEKTFTTDRQSPGKSFSSIIKYLARILGHDFYTLENKFFSMFGHMLQTRLKINFAQGVPEDKTIYNIYLERFNQMLEGKDQFSKILTNLLKELDAYAVDIKDRSKFITRLKLLDNLLFTELPWFGSPFQASEQDLDLLNHLQQVVFSKRQNLAQYINSHFLQTAYKLELNEYLSTMDKFLADLSDYMNGIRDGIRWSGVSNFNHSASESKQGADLPQDTTHGPGDSKRSLVSSQGSGTLVAQQHPMDGLNLRMKSSLSTTTIFTTQFRASQNSLAIKHFTGQEKNNDSKDLRDFKNWYSDRTIIDIIFSQQSKSVLRCVFLPFAYKVTKKVDEKSRMSDDSKVKSSNNFNNIPLETKQNDNTEKKSETLDGLDKQFEGSWGSDPLETMSMDSLGTYVAPKKTKEITSTFERQFRQMQLLTINLQAGFSCFVSFEPDDINSNKHFIFGIYLKSALLIIDPMGKIPRDFFLKKILQVQKDNQIKKILFSKTKIQNDPAGDVSCGPICTELMLHLSCLNKNIIDNALNKAPTTKFEKKLNIETKISSNEVKFEYYTVDLTDTKLLPKSLNQLKDCKNEQYTQAICAIRQSHLKVLESSNHTEQNQFEHYVFCHLVQDKVNVHTLRQDARYQQLAQRFGAPAEKLQLMLKK